MFQFLNATGRLGSARMLEESVTQPVQPYSTAGELYGAAKGVTVTSLHALGKELDIEETATQELADNPEAQAAFLRARSRAPFFRPGIAPVVRPDQYTTKYTDRDEIKSLMADLGKDFHDDIKIPPAGMSLARAQVFQEQKEQYDQNIMVLNQARPGLSKWAPIIAGSLAEGIKDPINLIPFGGSIGAGAKAAKTGKLFTSAGMQAAMKSAGKGAAANIAAVGAIDVATFPYANRWGAGLGWEHAAADVTIGGALGAFLGTAGHVVGRWKTAGMHQDSLLKASLDDGAGRPIDISRIVDDKMQILKERFPGSSTERARDILTRTEMMKAKAAGLTEVNVSKLIDDVQTTRTNIETNITSLKESVVDINNEAAVAEGNIRMSMQRTTELGTSSAQEILALEIRRDAMMDEMRIELEERVNSLRETESPAVAERLIERARNQAEPAIGDVYRNTQWAIENIRATASKAIASQEATTQAAREALSEIRGRKIKVIDEISAQMKERTKFDRRMLELKSANVATESRAPGELSMKVLGEEPEMVAARERTTALKDQIPATVSERPVAPNPSETAYREVLVDGLELSDTQRLELAEARLELNRSRRQREVLTAAVDCVTRSIV